MANDRLQKWALIAELIGAVAIIISLIFVGIQLRDNTRATRSANASEANALTVSWYLELGNNPQTSSLFYRYLTDFDSLSQEEKFQMVMKLHAVVLTFQNSFYLVDEGTLDDRIRDTITEAIVVVKDTPGWDYYWGNRRPLFFPKFQQYVDELMEVEREVSQSIYMPAEK